MTTNRPIILGVDSERSAQSKVAQLFNGAGVFYRFVTDRKKVPGGIRQLNPDLLVLFGEPGSDFVIQVLDGLAQDVGHSGLPVVLVAEDTQDASFVTGLRSGVVAVVKAPFDEPHVAVIRSLWQDLASRSGTASGLADGKTFARLLDHIRRARRSGLLTTDARTPNEGRASFVNGKLERASFLGASGEKALKAISGQPVVNWTFSEVAGQSGEGAGVVIEVGGEPSSGETDIPILSGEQLTELPDDEPLAFEVSVPVQAYEPPTFVSESLPPAPAGTSRLLLVDDDEALLRMFSALFTKHGFQVVTAVDGQAGAEVALSREFDVVLADLNMPRMDGWGMLRLLRDDFRTRELPVAFISAHDDYRESLRALDAGAQAYLSKGTRLEALVTQVKKLMEPRQTVLAQLDIGAPFSVQLATVGPQFFLKQLAGRKRSGILDARDGWAQYRLALKDGTCISASAQAGQFKAEAERAFNAFIASKNAEGSWSPGAPPADVKPNLFHDTTVQLERACATLNENEQRMREGLMVSATQIDVNLDLYAVYQQVGPKQWLEAARLICEEKVPPREVIARLDISPVEIEETMKDLIRRGVVLLRKKK